MPLITPHAGEEREITAVRKVGGFETITEGGVTFVPFHFETVEEDGAVKYRPLRLVALQGEKPTKDAISGAIARAKEDETDPHLVEVKQYWRRGLGRYVPLYTVRGTHVRSRYRFETLEELAAHFAPEPETARRTVFKI